MSLTIIKLDTPDGPRYLEYSSIVEAPITFGMTLQEFTDYYRAQYGWSGMDEFAYRLARVDARGTSSMTCDSAEQTLLGNRAGDRETELTKEQIVDWYCVKLGAGTLPIGRVR